MLTPHMFTGIGHAPQIECADEFAARTLAFVADAAAYVSQPT